MQKCKFCKYFNDFSNTFVECYRIMYNPKTKTESCIMFDCCSFFHTKYPWWQYAGEREKDCCKTQLTLF